METMGGVKKHQNTKSCYPHGITAAWDESCFSWKHAREWTPQSGDRLVMVKIFTPVTLCKSCLNLDPPLDESLRCRSSMRISKHQSAERKTSRWFNKRSQKAGLFFLLMLMITREEQQKQREDPFEGGKINTRWSFRVTYYLLSGRSSHHYDAAQPQFVIHYCKLPQ